MQEVIRRFKEHQKKMQAYSHAENILYYDARTAAPKNNVKGLSATLEVLSEESYKLSVDEGFIADIDMLMAHKDELDEQTRREAEFLYKEISRIRKIPMEEFVEYSVLKNESEAAWHKAKAENDYASFEPYLKKVVEFERRFALYYEPEKPVYDTLLDNYEEGLTTEMLDEYFGKVKERIVPLIKRIGKSKVNIRTDFSKREFPVWKQRILSDYLMEVMTIDRGSCAIGETEHPFTTNMNKYDVRITTKYKADMMTSNIFSVIHEGGHALYELNTGDELFGSVLATGTSMGIHESQSRFYENYIGRSREFVNYIFPKVKELFKEELSDVSAEEFYLLVNKSQPSLIRTEADEVTYPLHILIRYELEKKLIAGEIDTKDLPSEWNALYEKYLGVCPPDDTNGVLQDTHWSGGSFGYFPSYFVGSAYSAQILAAMEKDIDVWSLVKNGDLKPIVEWLTERIYRFGAARKPAEVLENCIHAPFDIDYFITYLEKKYSDIYKL